MMHGLLDKKFITEIKTSASFKDDSFAREYLARWTGGAEGSFFDYEKMSKHRTINNPEWAEKIKNGSGDFYLMSVDKTICPFSS